MGRTLRFHVSRLVDEAPTSATTAKPLRRRPPALAPHCPCPNPPNLHSPPSSLPIKHRRSRLRPFHVKQRRGWIAMSICSGNGRPKPNQTRTPPLPPPIPQ